MKLSEAQANYRPKSSASKPNDNRSIKSYLKAQLRSEAERTLGEPWQEIVENYRDEFLIDGSPVDGTATLVLRVRRGCTGFGGNRRPRSDLWLKHAQSELFEKN